MNYNDLVGIPFDENGDNRKGTNCYNLLRMAYEKNGIFVPKTDIAVCACRVTSNKEIEDHILKHWTLVERPIVICGVLIQSSDPDFANHIGTYIGNNKMLHISRYIKSTVESLDRYKRKIIAFGIFNSVREID